MARPDKVAAVEEITEGFKESTAAVMTEYRGLTVGQMKELRRSLGGTTTFAVVKNTLAKIGAKNAGITDLDDMLAGPSAIAFVKGDAVEAAKGLRDFAKANPLLVIKGAWMDGRRMSAAEVGKLADLESREVLLAKLAGAMNASMAKAAALFQAPLSKAARTIDALRAAAAANPSLLAAGAAPAAAEAAPAPAPAAEDSPAAAEESTEVSAESTAAESAEAPAAEASATADDAAAESSQAPEAADEQVTEG
jgi:large subunit ribosomal protein L10